MDTTVGAASDAGSDISALSSVADAADEPDVSGGDRAGSVRGSIRDSYRNAKSRIFRKCCLRFYSISGVYLAILLAREVSFVRKCQKTRNNFHYM